MLPLALLLLTALSLVAVGTLALANRVLSTSITTVHMSQAQAAAEGAAIAALASLEGDTMPGDDGQGAIAILEGSVEGVQFGARRYPLTSEWSLVEGWGRVAPRAPERRSALLIWGLDPIARVGSAAAVLVHGGPLRLSVGAAVNGRSMVDGAGDAECLELSPVVDSLFPSGYLRPSLRAPWEPELPDPPYIGLLGVSDLERILSVRLGANVAPMPVVAADLCVAAADNWGSPLDPDGPCGARQVAALAPGDLAMGPGEGQGLVVVVGSLTLAAGTVFSGFAAVRDSLRIGAGARISGMVRVGGSVRLEEGAEVVGDACAALLALRQAPGLTQPRITPVGPWLRPY